MEKETRAYRKVARVINGCRTRDHFSGAKRMIANYELLYGYGIKLKTLNYLYKNKKDQYVI